LIIHSVKTQVDIGFGLDTGGAFEYCFTALSGTDTGVRMSKRPPTEGVIMLRCLRSGIAYKNALKAASAIFPAFILLCFAQGTARAQMAQDPGPRGGPAGAGQFVSGLTTDQQAVETPSLNFFNEVNNVAGGTSTKRVGLGGRFDSNACNGCHAQPASGGSSLPSNPLFKVYQLMGDQNAMPFFETSSGPTLVARAPYQSDLVTPNGHVQQLFTITGRTDAGTCDIQQPDFNELAAENNLIFRQTTPFFGGGLLEIINDSDIIANENSNLTQKMALGISGNPNINADDGSVNRFGWKAQKRSLILFAGEAYNVEEGIDNEFFPNKTDETPGCTPPFPLGPPNGNGTHGVPDDRTDWAVLPASGFLMPGDPERFGIYGRLLAGPTPGSCPGPNSQSCNSGQIDFNTIGCQLCHNPTFTTPPSSIAALSNQPVNLYSDLLVHHMGICDADNITQGQATGDEFRTMPLWGVGQRYFFMHDGRTKDIVQAVLDHSCAASFQYGPSEANAVVVNFNNLANVQGVDGSAQQDLINFLRSL
jgi:CxxC motif-containing protein (DUF1111 family)